jgi:negative regulator of sigma E activity
VYFDKEITVSFVPLVKNPYEYDYVKEALEQDDRMQNRFYVDGLYIMRIAVVPSKREELYYYSTGRDSVRSAVIKDNKRVTLTREEIVEEMKRKF